MRGLRRLIVVTRIDSGEPAGDAQLSMVVVRHLIMDQIAVPAMSAINHHTMRDAGPRSSNRDQRQHR